MSWDISFNMAICKLANLASVLCFTFLYVSVMQEIQICMYIFSKLKSCK
jgi:hypothetical protein